MSKKGIEQTERCIQKVRKVEAELGIPYWLLGKEKKTVYLQEGDFPEGRWVPFSAG